MSDKREDGNEKLKTFDRSRFQKGYKGGAGEDSSNESGQGLEKQQEKEMEQGM